MAGKYLNARGMAVLAALDEVAGEYKSTPASVALAWLMTQPGIAAPITSATNEMQLDDLAAAGELKLGRAALEILSAA
jgi:aryl-alcohol dehydrogenase-like predicted oxidoreductase